MRNLHMPAACLVAAMSLILSHSARAADLVTTTVHRGTVEMTTADGRPLLRAGAAPIHLLRGRRDLHFEVQIEPQSNGFDVILTAENTSSVPTRAGTITIGDFILGDTIHWRNFRIDGQEIIVDRSNPNTLPGSSAYPGQLYSPVAVFRNEEFTIGLSVHYPLLEYEQSLRIDLLPSPARLAGQEPGWRIEVELRNIGDAYPDKLAPGETRQYRVSVRVTDQKDQWMQTLVPYRDYFRSLYGGVAYARNPEPVQAIPIAMQSRANASSPHGFIRTSARPDIHGWGPWADELKRHRREWTRTMVWTPTGVYRRNQQNNFPFQFTTHWLEGIRYHHNMGDAVQKLSEVPTSSFALGLWWGRTCQVMSEWDTPDWEAFDPDNSAHVAAAQAELDLAVQAGATMIGLDAYTHSVTPIWDLHRWMKMMQERYPQVAFITESRKPDILHRLSPTYIDAYVYKPSERTLEKLRNVRTPLLLADFLLPGHETWAGLAFNRIEQVYVGGDVPAHVIREEAQRAAQLGYVSVIFASEAPRAQEFDAAESWLTTVPPDLQIAAGPSVQVAGDNGENDSGADAATTNNSGADSPDSEQGSSVTSDGVVIVNSGDGAVGAPSDGEIHRPFEDEAEKPKRRRPLVFLRSRKPSTNNNDDDENNEDDDDGE